MLNLVRRLFGLRPRQPRLKLRPEGFVILYPGFPWASLEVRWIKVLEIRARRDGLPARNDVQLHFKFEPGKILGESISETWPGFAAVRSVMEASLALNLPDWWRQVARLTSSTEELVVHQRSDRRCLTTACS